MLLNTPLASIQRRKEGESEPIAEGEANPVNVSVQSRTVRTDIVYLLQFQWNPMRVYDIGYSVLGKWNGRILIDAGD